MSDYQSARQAMHVTEYLEFAGRYVLEQGAQYRPRQGVDLFAIDGGRAWCKVGAQSRADLKLVENTK